MAVVSPSSCRALVLVCSIPLGCGEAASDGGGTDATTQVGDTEDGTSDGTDTDASAGDSSTGEAPVPAGLPCDTPFEYQGHAGCQAMVEGLDSLEEVTGGSVVKLARDASKTAVYQMNATVARQILKSLRR